MTSRLGEIEAELGKGIAGQRVRSDHEGVAMSGKREMIEGWLEAWGGEGIPLMGQQGGDNLERADKDGMAFAWVDTPVRHIF